MRRHVVSWQPGDRITISIKGETINCKVVDVPLRDEPGGDRFAKYIPDQIVPALTPIAELFRFDQYGTLSTLAIYQRLNNAGISLSRNTLMEWLDADTRFIPDPKQDGHWIVRGAGSTDEQSSQNDDTLTQTLDQLTGANRLYDQLKTRGIMSEVDLHHSLQVHGWPIVRRGQVLEWLTDDKRFQRDDTSGYWVLSGVESTEKDQSDPATDRDQILGIVAKMLIPPLGVNKPNPRSTGRLRNDLDEGWGVSRDRTNNLAVWLTDDYRFKRQVGGEGFWILTAWE